MKPILVLNIAWMRDHRGVTGDTPEGTFRFMREGGTPHEVLNFLPAHGRYYGYAPVHDRTINITRLGASPNDDFIDDVLVVWTDCISRSAVVYMRMESDLRDRRNLWPILNENGNYTQYFRIATGRPYRGYPARFAAEQLLCLQME